MGNRGFEPLPDDWDGRGQGVSDHSVNRDGGNRHGDLNLVKELCSPTSVGEQIRRGGWTRSDKPQGNGDVDLPAHKYQGGSSNGRFNPADYPGGTSA